MQQLNQHAVFSIPTHMQAVSSFHEAQHISFPKAERTNTSFFKS